MIKKVGNNLPVGKFKVEELAGGRVKRLKFFREWTIRKMKEETMILTDFQVQHVLRAYSQQLSTKSRISKEKAARPPGQKDEVTLSKESKRMLIIDKIAQEIVAQLANGFPYNQNGRAVLDRLSQEYGRRLDVAPDQGKEITFKVLGDTNDSVKEYLAPAENDQLRKRLVEMAKSFVREQLI